MSSYTTYCNMKQTFEDSLLSPISKKVKVLENGFEMNDI